MYICGLEFSYVERILTNVFYLHPVKLAVGLQC